VMQAARTATHAVVEKQIWQQCTPCFTQPIARYYACGRVACCNFFAHRVVAGFPHGIEVDSQHPTF